MASCETALWSFVRSIEPTAAQKEAASRSHNNLRDLLNSGQMKDRITGSYLSGSYSRDTAIRPIDDVDIIFLIDKTKWPGLYGYFDPEPDKVLTSFAAAIRYRYPISSVFGQRRSVRLELYHLDIDVVPAIPKDAQSDLILIPDREKNSWIPSSPKRHAQSAATVNQKHSGRFKPLVKLLKFWNSQLPSTTNIRSFAIETIATRFFATTELVSLENGLYRFFDFIAYTADMPHRLPWRSKCGISLGWLGLNIPDVADTGGNVGAGIDDSRRVKFISAAVRSREKVEQALNAITADTAWSRMSEALRA